MSQQDKPPRRTVSSWKEIAAHFGVTIRTVQIWEAERGLPVYRLPGIRGRVFAYTDELDAWAKPQEIGTASTQMAGSGGIVRTAAFAILGILAIGAAAYLLQHAHEPSSWAFAGRTLTVKDADGSFLWSNEFPEGTQAIWETDARLGGMPHTRPVIVDLDGDGRRELLFTVSVDDTESGRMRSELYCFEGDGAIRWTWKPGKAVATAKEEFPPPYRIRAVVAEEAGPGKAARLLVASFHSIHFPSQVAALNPRGEMKNEYWHSGHVAQMHSGDMDGDGNQELYLAAFHNASKSVSVVALDPEDFGGASAEADPDYQLTGLGPPKELGRILIPSSAMTRQIASNSGVGGSRLQEGRLFLSVWQQHQFPAGNSLPGVDYLIGPRLALISAQYSATFQASYDDLVRDKVIRPYNTEADLERIKQAVVVTPWQGRGAAR